MQEGDKRVNPQELNETCDTGGNAKVRVYLHTESGKTLFDKSYTE